MNSVIDDDGDSVGDGRTIAEREDEADVVEVGIDEGEEREPPLLSGALPT